MGSPLLQKGVHWVLASVRWVIQLGKAGSEGCSFEAVSQCAKHSSAGRFQRPCLKLHLLVATEVLQGANSACLGALQWGKESQLQKSSSICHLLSFSPATTFLAGFPGEWCNRVVHTEALTELFSHCRTLFFAPFWHLCSPCEGRHWTSVTHLSELLRAPARFSLGQTGKRKSPLISQLTHRHHVVGAGLVLSILFEAKHEKLFLALLLRGLQDRKGQFSSSSPAFHV